MDWANFYLANLAYSDIKPKIIGDIKCLPEDFIVEEVLGFELSGDGDHLCLFVEKKCLNTSDLVEQLASHFQVRRESIGYCGLKDKFAITRQWISVDLSVSSFDASHINTLEDSQSTQAEGFKVLKTGLNRKKLKIGNHKGNKFTIVVKNIRPLLEAGESPIDNAELDKPALDSCLQKIRSAGFPNYFGEQRFGRAYSNLYQLDKPGNFKGKRSKKRGMLISVLRSVIFNAYLSERLASGSEASYQDGDVLVLKGSNSTFKIDAQNDDEVEQIGQRLAEGDIYISGPLVGGDNNTNEDKLSLSLLERFSDYQTILQKNSVKASRRALSCIPDDLSWIIQISGKQDADQNSLILDFVLPKGVFATALLREIVAYEN